MFESKTDQPSQKLHQIPFLTQNPNQNQTHAKQNIEPHTQRKQKT